jgi:hypothetical protein
MGGITEVDMALLRQILRMEPLPDANGGFEEEKNTG